MKAENNGQAFGCVRNTIRLRSGRYFDLADPRPDTFTLSDIAGALAKLCRFGGQIDRFYSVAEHSVFCFVVARQDGLGDEVAAACLFHDAAEAFVGDIVKPLKVMLPAYDGIEARVERAIGTRFGIDFTRHRDAVRKIDREMLIAERRKFFGRDGVVWTGENTVRAIDPPLEGWPPKIAEGAFLGAADKLGYRDLAR